MKTYVLKRLLLMIPTLFGVSLVVWTITALAPEPPIQSRMPGVESGQKAGEAGTMTRAVKAYRAQYGLDKPAILNFYYELDPDEVEATLREAGVRGSEDPEQIKRTFRAKEQLIRWGYYAVPAIVEVLSRAEGDLRGHAAAWFLNNAERVTRFDPSAELDEETAAENVHITTENRILALYAFPPDAPPERKEAGVAAVQSWYRGAKADFPEGEDVESVRAAVAAADDARIDGWGARAVPALVRLVLEDEDLRDGALAALVSCARRSGDGSELRTAALEKIAWDPTAAPARRRAGLALLRDWWEGSESRWDASGLSWLGTLLLETQFAHYWGNLLRFDLGYSSKHKQPVGDLIMERLKYSLTLSVSSLVLAFLISVPLGLLSARIHGSLSEKGITVILFILYSLPSFFVATLLLRYLAEGQKGSLELIPTGGFESADAWELTTVDRIRDILWHVAAPIFCLTYASFAALSRYAKSGLLNVIRSDYVRTARAKGLSDFVVTYKHAARPGIIPVITLLGGTLPVIVSGSFIIEWIFGIPGFGRLMVESVRGNDLNVIVGITLIVAILTMIGILLSDLLYAVADPRISFS